MRISSCSSLCLALLLPSAGGMAVRPTLSRRAVVGGVAAAAAVHLQPASASLRDELAAAEAELSAASGIDDTTAAYRKLQSIAESYGGLPTAEQTEALVNLMRTKRSTLQGMGDTAWNGITEEAYNGLMRTVDPWRVVELAPKLAGAIYTFPVVYIALLAVQQLAPKFFRPAYGAGVALVLGPLFLQIVIG